MAARLRGSAGDVLVNPIVKLDLVVLKLLNSVLLVALSKAGILVN